MKSTLVKLCTLSLAILCVACGAPKEQTHFFVQLSDPQLGFINESEDFSPEQENMERIAAAVNRLQPNFVVITGDYVQWRTDENALEGFDQMCKLFDKEIPLYLVPGNHDVGEATPEDVAKFVARYGSDRFVHNGENYTAIGYNSCIIKTAAVGEPAEYEWLKEQLTKASERNLPIIVASHHPLFVESPDEDDAGVNIPLEMRTKYLNLFTEYNVDLALSGHLHHCVRAEHEGVQLATTGAAGRALGEEGSGITIVTIKKGTPTPTFYEIANIPQAVD